MTNKRGMQIDKSESLEVLQLFYNSLSYKTCISSNITCTLRVSILMC